MRFPAAPSPPIDARLDAAVALAALVQRAEQVFGRDRFALHLPRVTRCACDRAGSPHVALCQRRERARLWLPCEAPDLDDLIALETLLAEARPDTIGGNMTDEKLPLGELIAHLRGAHGFTRTALATKVGISPTGLRKIEQGESAPTLTMLIALAFTLGRTPQTLLELAELDAKARRRYAPLLVREVSGPFTLALEIRVEGRSRREVVDALAAQLRAAVKALRAVPDHEPLPASLALGGEDLAEPAEPRDG